MKKKFSVTEKIIISGLFSGLAIIFATLRIVIPGVCKISFDGPFYKFISIIFGPFYGGISALFAEAIGAFLTPVGNYIPLFSITGGLRGFLVGFIYRLLDKFSWIQKKFFKLGLSVFTSDFFISFLNSIIIKFYSGWSPKIFLIKMFIRFGKEFFLVIINVIVLKIMLSIYAKIIEGGN